VEEIPIISHPDFIVPPDFRLQRASFDGQNFTHGIAHYDARERSDPLLCKDYVTDMFQHFFLAEVRFDLLRNSTIIVAQPKLTH
jgi:hypothetical protein